MAIPCSLPRSRGSSSNARYIAILIATHVSAALSIGILRSCGVLYWSWQHEFDTTASQTAAVQSIMSSVQCFSGVIAGILTQRFGCKSTGILGGVLATSGLLYGNWATSIGQLYLMATLVGVGSGLAYIAGLSAVALYFTKRYKLANSFTISGAGTGNISFPPLIQLLLDRYGQRGAMLITSSLIAHLIVCAALFRSPKGQNRSRQNPQPLKLAVTSEASDEEGPDDEKQSVQTPEDPGSLSKESVASKFEVSDKASVDLEAVTHVEDGPVDSKLAVIATIGGWIVSLLKRFSSLIGLSVICRKYRFLFLVLLFCQVVAAYDSFLVFIVPFARSRGDPAPSAAFLLTFLGIGSLVGRLGHGPLISGKVPELVMYAVFLILAGISAILVNVDVHAVRAVASCMQGLSTGAQFGILLVLTRQFVGSENFSVCFGWCYSFGGIGALLGPIVLGRVLDLTGSYSTVFYVTSVIYFSCALQVAIFPLLKRLESRQLATETIMV